MIKPALQDEAFLADVRQAREDVDHFHLWWLGQSGFLVQWSDYHILLDPYLSDSLTEKYERTEKPHVRMTERVVAPECLDFIQAVSSSHTHTDHLDAKTLKPLIRANPQMEIIIPEANRTFVTDRLNLVTDLPIGLDAGDSVRVGPFKFHAVPAAHEKVERDEYGRHQYLGYVIEFDRWSIYHSGDTMLFDGMESILGQWRIDVAMLPINGRAPERKVAGNLSGREAAELGKRIHARMVIPCHYEMFEFNTADPAEFSQAAEALEQPHRALRCGERWSSEELLKVSDRQD